MSSQFWSGQRVLKQDRARTDHETISVKVTLKIKDFSSEDTSLSVKASTKWKKKNLQYIYLTQLPYSESIKKTCKSVFKRLQD